MKAAGLLTALLLFACSACSGKSDASDTELEAAAAAGRRHAEKALSYPDSSMEREKAVFGIRARETRLRDAGFEACADAYIESAAQVLGYD